MLKIVIIEKEPFTLLGIKTAIEQSPDIEVSASAMCGEIGLKLVEQTKPDVVVVDILLPDMNGLDLTRSIKKTTDSKVVILTNQANEDIVNSAFSSGADDYLLKTTDIELVELAIKKAYFNEFLLDPKLTKKVLSSCYQNNLTNTTSKGKNFPDPPTDTKIQIRRLLAEGLSYEDIAQKMFISVSPEADLRIVGTEVRGEDKFLLRAKTAATSDKSQLSAEYFDTYNDIKALPEREIKLLLAEKDSIIQSLETMITTALERPNFYSNVEQVGFMTNNPGGISQNVSGGQVYGGMQAAQGNQNQQTQETNVVASSEKQLTQEDVIRLLAQIEQLVGTSSELPEVAKEKTLKYLGAAKEEAQNPEPDKQLAAGNLKRMAETLKTTSETVASTKSLWENAKPILLKLPGWLGVAKSFFGF